MNTPNLSDYSAYLLRDGRKPSTTYRHLHLLKTLFNELSEWTPEELENFLNRYKLQDKRHSYINQFIDVYCSYCRFKGIPPPHIKRFKDQPFSKATMSDDEIEEFLKLPCKRPGGAEEQSYKVWTVFFSILAFTGMRPGEVAKLKIDDCDFGRGVFVIEENKTDNPRRVPIAPNIEPLVKEHISLLKSEYLFPSPRGGNKGGGVFDSVDWHYRFHERIKRLGIKRKNLTPYSLRHSLITALLESGANIFEVMKIVGHRRIETTYQYTHLTTKDIKDAMNKLPSIRKALDPGGLMRAFVEIFVKMFSEDPRFEKTIEQSDDEVVIRIKVKK